MWELDCWEQDSWESTCWEGWIVLVASPFINSTVISITEAPLFITKYIIENTASEIYSSIFIREE